MGGNGAGKTTLLKTIAGLYRPTSGSVVVHSRVVYLAGLGVGMMRELSVRRNFYLYGTICGLRRERLDAIIGDALDWPELSEYVGARVRTLSQGIKARLAFSVVRHIEADVVLMDEAFAAGDDRFRSKCEDFFREDNRANSAIVVSTHSMPFVSRMCTRAIWLREGQVAMDGEPDAVVSEYQSWAKRR